MRTKICLIVLITLLFCVNTKAQTTIFFKDFNYSTMTGIDSFPRQLRPKFYVACDYDKDGRLIGIRPTQRFEAQWSPIESKITVIQKPAYTILFLGAGKTKMGYARTIFQGKEYVTNSGFVTHDTLIFKSTRKDHIDLQLFTNTNGDSIHFKALSFSFDKNNKLKKSPLASFENYRQWFTIDSSAFYITENEIQLKRDPIMVWHTVKQNYSFNLINITKNNFKEMPSMPVSLFWLKNSGLLY